MKQDENKLSYWKQKLFENLSEYQEERTEMTDFEKLYAGTREIDHSINSSYQGATKRASYVRNIVAELVEAIVDSNIPSPKVTALREKDQKLANVIEDYLRNELDRLPMEELNDQDERTTPIQGGDFFLVEWDSKRRTHTTAGELTVSLVHPKQFIPQSGVTRIEDMDYFFIQVAKSKEWIKKQYGVDVENETESDPEIRSGEKQGKADDLVTQNIAYYRNRDGGVGRYSWTNEYQLEDIEDYQARRASKCTKCGAEGAGVCQVCGGKTFQKEKTEYEILLNDVYRSDGSVIPCIRQGKDGIWEQVKIPYYEPKRYPFVCRKNVSLFGKLLGDSDVGKIRDQQNMIKKLGTKIEEKLLTGGSILTKPSTVKVKLTDEEFRVANVEDAAQKSLIDVINLQANVQNDVAYMENVYESARNTIGVTDSFQGRKDTTATSGTAKQFAAAQTAGRLESKRVMKNAAYSALFELMFQFLLAYSDEPRQVVSKNRSGGVEYSSFNRYDFLEQDEAGEWYWNDRFMFSCDPTSPLANNREAMWQETRMNLQTGAFGDPTNLQTLILFWTKMELLHYPGASDTKAFLEKQWQEQQAMMMQQSQMQQLAQPVQPLDVVGNFPSYNQLSTISGTEGYSGGSSVIKT